MLGKKKKNCFSYTGFLGVTRRFTSAYVDSEQTFRLTIIAPFRAVLIRFINRNLFYFRALFEPRIKYTQ